MAEQEGHSSRAEQRMAAVAKLKRAASLPRMKDGRRPPMHSEAVSEGEKVASEDDRAANSEEERSKGEVGEVEIIAVETSGEPPDVEETTTPPEPQLIPLVANVDNAVDADSEMEERPMSPSVAKKRRSRSRSRSRGSKDFKSKIKQPPISQFGGDSSQDENPMVTPQIMLPAVPPLASPIPHFPFLQPSRFLRSPTPLSPDLPLFYPGTSPPTPLPTLEDLQRGLIRSNSVGHSTAGRRAAMHKLTGGTETYEDSPSPTPPPLSSKLGRNNTISGGERIAARQNMLSRLGTRVNREADVEAASGEDRAAPSPTPNKRRRRRSRRASNANPPAVSDSDFHSSTTPNTPAHHPAPLPYPDDHYAGLRAFSTTPNQLSSSRTQSSERQSDIGTPPPPLPTFTDGEGQGRAERPRRRSLLVEDPDDEDQQPPPQTYPTKPGTPQKGFQTVDASQMHEASTPSPISAHTSTAATGLNHRAPSRNEPIRNDIFTTPITERPLSDEDEEQVLYPSTTARPRTPYGNMMDSSDREISWIASPVPEIRMPIDDDDDESDYEQDISRPIEVLDAEPDEEQETPLSAASSNGFLAREYDDDTSPRASLSSKSVILESETYPDNVHPESSNDPTQPFSDVSVSPQVYPQRLSIASRIQSVGDRSPQAAEFLEWEERHASPGPDPRRQDTSTSSAWEKVKNTFSRSASSTGRRSRTNSIVNREKRDDSSASRESGASLTSSRTDKAEHQAHTPQYQAPPLMQTPSASASILSLSPHAPPRGSVSPIPPPSSADMARYQSSKLFPFPGIVKLEEERRAKGYNPASASSPDVSIQPSDEPHAGPMAHSYFANLSQGENESRLNLQSSDPRPNTPYASDMTNGVSTGQRQPEYVDLSSSQNKEGYNLKLPMTLPGVKQWLSKNSKKKTSSPAHSNAGSVSYSASPPLDSPATSSSSGTYKRPPVQETYRRRELDPVLPWEEGPSDVFGKLSKSTGDGISSNGMSSFEAEHTPKAHNVIPLSPGYSGGSSYDFNHEPSTGARFASATPDPSSLSDYPAPTPSESSSTSSHYSLSGQQASNILDRIDESLRDPLSPMWANVMDDPPRKLILSSPVLQVVNANTVKDRFLFLFNDMLVIAKPITFDHENFIDTYKLSLPDRKYSVKNVVHLQDVRFCADRFESQAKSTTLGNRSTLIRSFVSQFAKDPDNAVTTLIQKSNTQDDPSLLGQLLFKTLDLDRSRLGEYLSRRTSKSILKAYLDSFGFTGLRVDVALRVFLHSVNISQNIPSYGAFDHLLDSFSSRWYEANARSVAYDKNSAILLVQALVQLNDRLHGPIADEPGPTNHIRRTVTTKEFIDAFRRCDPRYQVSDELLTELYRSIFHEHLCQACPSLTAPHTPIMIKRALPPRLTYKAQSEPIVLRLPQPDPLFTIELYGQDLIFDPPVLHFSRSSEASFRVTGTSLGSKTMTMCRSGPNAIKYSGLPLTHSIAIERAFMKNTFQIAFLDPAGAKRRYMFSVDDPIIRNEWATCLKRQIDATNAGQVPGNSLLGPGNEAQSASRKVAFKVLQEKLVGPPTDTTQSHVGSSPGPRSNGGNGNALGSSQRSDSSLAPFSSSTNSPSHSRSKSRSKVYHRHGAGKFELDLGMGYRSENSSSDSNANDYRHRHTDSSASPEQKSDTASWTSRDLEMQCQQNSSISVVLSFLQVGTGVGVVRSGVPF